MTLGSYVLAGVAIAVAVAMLGDELGRHIHAFESWGAGLGPGALLVFVLLYVVLDSVFVPDTLLGIIAGATFGFVEGFTVVAAGSIIAGLLQFAMSRRLLKPFIERKIATRPALSAMREAVLREQLKLQLLIRLTPINRALTSYVLGASGVRFSRFALAGIALVPHIALEVYFGFAGKNLARAASVPENIDRAQDVALALGLVVTFAVLALVSRIARKAVAGAIGEAQPTSTAQ